MSKKSTKKRNPTATKPKDAKPSPRKRLLTCLIAVAAVLVALIVSAVVYFCTGYEANMDAREALISDDLVHVEQHEDLVVFAPEKPTAGFIFYPGANTEHIAYAPLMAELTRQGILCVLVDMPLDHAFLDRDAADAILDTYTDVDTWYIGGHGMGGRTASKYAHDHADRLEGLVLLGTHTAADLSDTELDVLSIYGDRDGVMDMDRYRKALKKLPADHQEEVIEGGNHACFGSYGDHRGDDPGILSSYVQTKIAAETIAAFFAA